MLLFFLIRILVLYILYQILFSCQNMFQILVILANLLLNKRQIHCINNDYFLQEKIHLRQTEQSSLCRKNHWNIFVLVAQKNYYGIYNQRLFGNSDMPRLFGRIQEILSNRLLLLVNRVYYRIPVGMPLSLYE